MRILMAFFIVVHLSVSALAKPTPFQKNIRQCLGEKIEASKLKNIKELYEILDKIYSLRSSETIYREVLYKEKSDTKKLKLEKGRISVFKVLDDNTISLLNNDARQKGLTDDSSINQLLASADIMEDWVKVKEMRAEQSILIFNRQQGQLKSLSFEKANQKMRLECSEIDLADICLCRP